MKKEPPLRAVDIGPVDDPRDAWPIMRQLRPHLDETTYLVMCDRMMQDGYRLAAVREAGAIVAVAGYRFSEMLYRGRFLYVDDLVSDAEKRGAGHGSALLGWLEDQARSQGCAQLVLDSGVQRKDAHRFYERHGMKVLAYNFTKEVA